MRRDTTMVAEARNSGFDEETLELRLIQPKMWEFDVEEDDKEYMPDFNMVESSHQSSPNIEPLDKVANEEYKTYKKTRIRSDGRSKKVSKFSVDNRKDNYGKGRTLKQNAALVTSSINYHCNKVYHEIHSKGYFSIQDPAQKKVYENFTQLLPESVVNVLVNWMRENEKPVRFSTRITGRLTARQLIYKLDSHVDFNELNYVPNYKVPELEQVVQTPEREAVDQEKYLGKPLPEWQKKYNLNDVLSSALELLDLVGYKKNPELSSDGAFSNIELYVEAVDKKAVDLVSEYVSNLKEKSRFTRPELLVDGTTFMLNMDGEKLKGLTDYVKENLVKEIQEQRSQTKRTPEYLTNASGRRVNEVMELVYALNEKYNFLDPSKTTLVLDRVSSNLEVCIGNVLQSYGLPNDLGNVRYKKFEIRYKAPPHHVLENHVKDDKDREEEIKRKMFGLVISGHPIVAGLIAREKLPDSGIEKASKTRGKYGTLVQNGELHTSMYDMAGVKSLVHDFGSIEAEKEAVRKVFSMLEHSPFFNFVDEDDYYANPKMTKDFAYMSLQRKAHYHNGVDLNLEIQVQGLSTALRNNVQHIEFGSDKMQNNGHVPLDQEFNGERGYQPIVIDNRTCIDSNNPNVQILFREGPITGALVHSPHGRYLHVSVLGEELVRLPNFADQTQYLQHMRAN